MKRLVALLLALCLVFSLCACDGSSSDDSRASAKCQSCGRTFYAGDSAGNFKNIARTHMCNNCYNNFKYFTD